MFCILILSVVNSYQPSGSSYNVQHSKLHPLLYGDQLLKIENFNEYFIEYFIENFIENCIENVIENVIDLIENSSSKYSFLE